MDNNDSAYISREAKKIKSVIFLGGKCEECGESDHIFLDFHHKIMEEKTLEMSSMRTKNWKIIKNELSKCQLLCCKCHRKKHYNYERYERLKSNIEEKIKEIDYFTKNTIQISEEMKQKIIKLYNNSMKNYRKIAKFLNLRPSPVKTYLFECGIYKSGKYKEEYIYFKKYEEKIIKFYNLKYAMKKIIKLINCKYSETALTNKINSLILENKIIKRKMPAHNQVISDEELIIMYNKDIPLYKIAHEYNININTIRKRIKRLCVKNIIIPKISQKRIYE